MEKLLYYMWEHRLLGHAAPQTTDGRLIEVIDPGRRNVDAGPDFFQRQSAYRRPCMGGKRGDASAVERLADSIDTTKTEPTTR